MSHDEISSDIRKMRDSGTLDKVTAHAALCQPLEGEKLVRLDRIEKETRKQSTAIFGDEDLGIAGLVSDVKELKRIVFRAVWSISGVVAFCTFLLSLLALYIEAHK